MKPLVETVLLAESHLSGASPRCQPNCSTPQPGWKGLTATEVTVAYDKSVDAAYVYFTEPQARVRSAHTYPCDPMDVDGMITLDFDEHGRLIGVEVLAATSKLPEYLLKSAELLDADAT
ncbi:DUF2283 domain-containing protein [Streptomyces sp. NPDC048594]|uniref:DUF2283 domain-containing protein n=1 Tax=Streptomyces sp. NPDC048594 TaxID=3365575 RepID=UPI00371479C2